MDNYPETHQRGTFVVDNDMSSHIDSNQEVDFGIQIAHDGRIWICINGVAWIRFKPNNSDTTPEDDSLLARIAARRDDKQFMTRLAEIIKSERAVLDALAASERRDRIRPA